MNTFHLWVKINSIFYQMNSKDNIIYIYIHNFQILIGGEKKGSAL